MMTEKTPHGYSPVTLRNFTLPFDKDTMLYLYVFNKETKEYELVSMRDILPSQIEPLFDLYVIKCELVMVDDERPETDTIQVPVLNIYISDEVELTVYPNPNYQGQK